MAFPWDTCHLFPKISEEIPDDSCWFIYTVERVIQHEAKVNSSNSIVSINIETDIVIALCRCGIDSAILLEDFTHNTSLSSMEKVVGRGFNEFVAQKIALWGKNIDGEKNEIRNDSFPSRSNTHLDDESIERARSLDKYIVRREKCSS